MKVIVMLVVLLSFPLLFPPRVLNAEFVKNEYHSVGQTTYLVRYPMCEDPFISGTGLKRYVVHVPISEAENAELDRAKADMSRVEEEQKRIVRKAQAQALRERMKCKCCCCEHKH